MRIAFVFSMIVLCWTTVSAQDAAPAVSETTLAAEDVLWEGAQALDTADAYQNYLSRYPEGRFAKEASALVAEILSEPFRAERLVETALLLDREARRDVQSDLTLLGFDPRGVDGIFGAGTRGALMQWQGENGLTETGYLTADQITRLDAQAARRTAEMEAEAARLKAEQDRRDRLFWAETGVAGDAPGLRAYLDRFPDGAFAATATQQLAEFARAQRQLTDAEDRAAWTTATDLHSQAGYEGYLAVFPLGTFAAEARARIADLSAPEPLDAAAIAAEDALGLDGVTLRLIEARLSQMDFGPGIVDGGLDQDSRRAIRNFQSDRNLTVTGFINEDTISRLLIDGFKSIGQD